MTISQISIDLRWWNWNGATVVTIDFTSDSNDKFNEIIPEGIPPSHDEMNEIVYQRWLIYETLLENNEKKW